VTTETLVKIFDDSVLAVATAILAGATIALAKHTRALSRLTRELVGVEKGRDDREAQETRRADVARCLQLIEQIREMRPSDFASQLKAGAVPAVAPQIRALSLLASRYVKDPDTVQHLRELRQHVDNVRTGGNIGDNEEAIRRLFQLVQERAGWSIVEWRDELEMSTKRDRESPMTFQG